NKTQHVIYRTTDGDIVDLYTKQGDNTGWQARNITTEAKGPKAAGNPDAYFWKDTKTQHVLFRGEDKHIHELYLNVDKSAHNDLTPTAKAPDAAGDPSGYAEEGNKTEHVVFRTGDGDVVELFAKQGDSAGWKSRNLTAEAKAPKAAGNPFGYTVNESTIQG